MTKKVVLVAIIMNLLMAATSEAAWKADWDKVLAGAKKEGKLVIYTTAGSDLARAMTRKFNEKYGIAVDILTARGSEIAAKVRAERTAGLFNADIFMAGSTTSLAALRPPGYLADIKSALILPEVLDPKSWWGGKLPFVDKAKKHLISYGLAPLSAVSINREVVKPGVIESYYDILQPKWKGKILVNDPTVAGMGLSTFYILGSKILSFDYWRNMVTTQEPEVIRDQRAQLEWLSRGKYYVLFGAKPSTLAQFEKKGAPVKGLIPKEGTWLSVSGERVIALADRAPHPDAAAAWINWLLSKEGQTEYTRAAMGASARLDAPTDHLPPEAVRQSGVPYAVEDEDSILSGAKKYLPLAKEIFGPLLK